MHVVVDGCVSGGWDSVKEVWVFKKWDVVMGMWMEC